MTSLNGLRGGKWRSASFWHQDFLRHSGATPITMPWGPEVVKALQASTLDGLMVNVDSGFLLKVHETAPHILVSKDLWLGHLYLLSMNQQTWASLALQDQQAIVRATEGGYQKLGAVMERSFDTQLDELRGAGATVRKLSPGEVRQWASETKFAEVQDAWVAEQTSKGLTAPSDVLRQLRARMANAIR